MNVREHKTVSREPRARTYARPGFFTRQSISKGLVWVFNDASLFKRPSITGLTPERSVSQRLRCYEAKVGINCVPLLIASVLPSPAPSNRQRLHSGAAPAFYGVESGATGEAPGAQRRMRERLLARSTKRSLFGNRGVEFSAAQKPELSRARTRACSVRLCQLTVSMATMLVRFTTCVGAKTRWKFVLPSPICP
jgi:hypothetical protein